MAIASALPSLLTATAAPAVPWLSLNVTIVDNDRGASPSSYRARALGAGAQEVPPGTVHVIKQCFSVKMWPCQASFWSRWHDPVLGRWLGLTPEQPAHFLRGFPECPRAAPSRVGDPPGLGRRGGAQGAARGAIREKRYNLSDPGVHHTTSSLVRHVRTTRRDSTHYPYGFTLRPLPSFRLFPFFTSTAQRPSGPRDARRCRGCC